MPALGSPPLSSCIFSSAWCLSKVETLSQNNDENPVAEKRRDSEDGDTNEQTGAAMAGGLEEVESSPTLLERLKKTASAIVGGDDQGVEG